MGILKRLARLILGKELAVIRATIKSQEEDLRLLSAKLESSLSRPPEVKYGITRQAFTSQVVNKLEQPLIVSTSSSEYGMYCLGIQRALSVMEKEVVIG